MGEPTDKDTLARLSEAQIVEIHDLAGWSLSLNFGHDDKARDRMRAFSDAYRTGQLVPLPSDPASTITAQAAEIARLREALGHAIGIIEAHVDRDALGKNGDPETGMWPLLDEYLHHFRAALTDGGSDAAE